MGRSVIHRTFWSKRQYTAVEYRLLNRGKYFVLSLFFFFNLVVYVDTSVRDFIRAVFLTGSGDPEDSGTHGVLGKSTIIDYKSRKSLRLKLHCY